jgi:hypothetical protein
MTWKKTKQVHIKGAGGNRLTRTPTRVLNHEERRVSLHDEDKKKSLKTRLFYYS